MDSNLKIPQIGEYIRNIGTLTKIEDVVPKPPPPEKDYIFEIIEARCDLYRNNELLKHLYTLNDFYELNSCIKTAIEEMIDYATTNKITKDSEVELRVTKVSSLIRMNPTWEKNYYTKEYTDFKYKELGSRFNLPEPTETIIWTSRELLEVKNAET